MEWATRRSTIVNARHIAISTIGAFAAGNPYVTIVNPIQNSKIEGNSFLVSVKIAKAERLKIEVYEAKAGKLALHEPVFFFKSAFSFST